MTKIENKTEYWRMKLTWILTFQQTNKLCKYTESIEINIAREKNKTRIDDTVTTFDEGYWKSYRTHLNIY